MKRKIILFAVLLMICSAFAAPPTTMPHAFYGNTTINSIDTPNGAMIYATCGENSASIDVHPPGHYGGAGVDEEKLIVQGCSNGDTITFTISLAGYSGTSSITDTFESGAVEEKTLNFTGTETTTTTVSGGTSGVGGGTSAGDDEPESSKYVSGKVDITVGTIGTITISNSDEYHVTQVLIEVLNDENDIYIEVEKYTSKPTDILEDLLDTVYRYLKITVNNLDDSNIASAKIRFKVEKSWIEENGLDPDTVLLNRYSDGKWGGLETSMTDQDDTYYYYEASTPGFSYFAITANKTGICGNRICEAGENFQNCPEDCPFQPAEGVCGDGLCDSGEDCGSCPGDCPCARGYVCRDGVCVREETGEKKFPMKSVTILVLILMTLAVIVWLAQSMKEAPKK